MSTIILVNQLGSKYELVATLPPNDIVDEPIYVFAPDWASRPVASSLQIRVPKSLFWDPGTRYKRVDIQLRGEDMQGT